MIPDAAEVWKWYEELVRSYHELHINVYGTSHLESCVQWRCTEYRDRRRRMKEQNAS
jgi:hypothetical protein